MNISFIVPDRRLKIYSDKENILEILNIVYTFSLFLEE